MHYRFTMIVPLHRNDGSEIPNENWNWLHTRFLADFGGFTQQDVSGSWKNDSGKRIDDMSLEYSVLVEDVSKWCWWLESAKYVQCHWRQESVLITRATIENVEFIGESDAEPMDHNC